MTSILAMMSVYYLCDLAAAEQVLPAQEAMACMDTYQRIKLEFIDEPPAPLGTPERAAQNLLGYRGFKAWEAAHSDLVEALRDEARRRLGY